MVSLCFKSLNKNTIKNLEELIEKSNIKNVVFSIRKFSKFYNLIIHYTGTNSIYFYSSISDLFSIFIINSYENKLLLRQLKLDFFYFTFDEQNEIYKKTKELLDNANIVYEKKEILCASIYSYIKNNKSCILDGFINFRISNYLKYINHHLENAVHEFVIHKEYIEYISLLKDYIHEKTPCTGLIHVIYSCSCKSLFDENFNLITTTSQKKYLSDISFSENDFILNSLLSLTPAKIIIHCTDKQDTFLNFLSSIFEDRCEFCSSCKFCITALDNKQQIP